MSTINTEVASRLTNIAPVVSERVINHLVEKEVSRRSDAVISALGTIDKLTADLKKFKPDIVSYNSDGTEASSSWSKPKLDEKNKLESNIAKLNKAVEKALTENDFADLLNLTKQSQPQQEKAAQ